MPPIQTRDPSNPPFTIGADITIAVVGAAGDRSQATRWPQCAAPNSHRQRHRRRTHKGVLPTTQKQ